MIRRTIMSDMIGIMQLSEEYKATTDRLFIKMEQLKEKLKESRREEIFNIEKRIDLLQSEISDMRRVYHHIQRNYG